MSTKINNIEVLKADEGKRLVYGVVLRPEVPDAHDDVMTSDEIMKSAHNYLMFYRVVGEQHDKEADAMVAESYIAPMDMNFDGKSIKKGAWVVAMKVLNDELWIKIKDGNFTGLSAGGFAKRNEIV